MFKTREDKEELVKMLDVTVETLADDKIGHDVFNGGCMFVASVLAEGFENLNIPFDVIIYEHRHDEKNLTPEQLASEGYIRHVSISMKIGGKIYEIGKKAADRLMNDEPDIPRSVHHMSSREIMDIYDKYEWTDLYDTQNNDNVRNEIELTFSMMS